MGAFPHTLGVIHHFLGCRAHSSPTPEAIATGSDGARASTLEQICALTTGSGASRLPGASRRGEFAGIGAAWAGRRQAEEAFAGRGVGSSVN